jgi:hypothetical protein
MCFVCGSLNNYSVNILQNSKPLLMAKRHIYQSKKTPVKLGAVLLSIATSSEYLEKHHLITNTFIFWCTMFLEAQNDQSALAC